MLMLGIMLAAAFLFAVIGGQALQAICDERKRDAKQKMSSVPKSRIVPLITSEYD